MAILDFGSSMDVKRNRRLDQATYGTPPNLSILGGGGDKVLGEPAAIVKEEAGETQAQTPIPSFRNPEGATTPETSPTSDPGLGTAQSGAGIDVESIAEQKRRKLILMLGD